MAEETAPVAEGGQALGAPAGEVSGGSEQTGGQPGPVAFTLEDGTPVTVEEARNGYLRQQDYTRKTQEVSQTRKENEADLALAQWINENPVEAVDWLVKQIEPLREGSQQTADEVDPIMQEIEELRSWQAEQNATQQRQAIESEIARLQKDIGPFEPDELLKHAVERNIPDLEVALIHMNALKARGNSQRTAEEIERAKQGLPPVTTRGTGETAPTTKKNPSVHEALMEALAEHHLDRMPLPD